jgi:hypothetical protein
MAQNTAICSQPLSVMGAPSEPLGADERENQVDEQHDDHDAAENVVEQHGQSRSHRAA